MLHRSFHTCPGVLRAMLHANALRQHARFHVLTTDFTDPLDVTQDVIQTFVDMQLAVFMKRRVPM